MAETTKVAAVQMDVAFSDVDCNLDRVRSFLHKAASRGARLIVFPECALTGYCFTSKDEAMPAAYEAQAVIPDLVDACRAYDVTAVVGTLLPDGDALYNAALTVTPDAAEPSVYRKTHLPFLGIDKHTAKGGCLEVVDTPVGRVGTIICYDLRFPEAARTLGLKGADIICVPTNWPEGAESSPDFVARTRAYENRAWLVACNRVGTERGFTFIGRSQICDPGGAKVAEADGSSETILYADVDVSRSRDKRVIIRPGEFEMDLFGDRRPEIYG
ncbi:MAG TPA: carbon-nitrogen hydrolase family protein [Armatimonadota bacterium]|jgi:predicted amidohydrolase